MTERQARMDPLDIASFAAQHVIDKLGSDVPAAFWEDRFALGFMQMLITLTAISNGLPQTEIESTIRVWAEILGKDARKVTDRIAALHNSRDATYQAGANNATRFVTFRGVPQDELSRRATEYADKTIAAGQAGDWTHDELVGMYSFDALFIAEIKKRLPELFDTRRH